MFTGIVLGQGEVLAVEPQGRDVRLRIRALCELPDLIIGESIAVNGACITVESGANNRFTGYVSATSLEVTTLGSLRTGSLVNLERALALGNRLGGHLVSGHVDAVAHVRYVESAGQSRRIGIAFPPEFAPEVILKGSVTLDGVSLTVNACDHKSLEVNVIPETWRVTTVGQWQTGSLVNFETDLIGKYVRRNLTLSACPDEAPSMEQQSKVNEHFLRENGFISGSAAHWGE